jgi:hypothetical protein
MGRDNPARPQDHSVFGLRVRSSIPLPELFLAEGPGTADVTISLGPIAEARDAEPGLTPVDGGLLLFVPNVGRYRIELGRRITVEPEPGVPERNLRLFLLGSAFGALLHQRGLLPLHANAVEIGGSAVAFMGPSGAGKSTLAAWFHDRGCRVLADDVCVIGFDGASRPYASPGLPRLRLWADVLQRTGRDLQGLNRSFLGDEDEKYDVPLDAALAARSKMPLAAIYLLDQEEEFSISPLHGIEAADAIFANTYRGEFLANTSGQREHWNSAVGLVRATPVFRATRRWDLAALDKQCSALLRHARELVTQGQPPSTRQPAAQP